jgi:Plasmid replication region DNA-binding N-term
MLTGEYPSVAAVRTKLQRGSVTTISEAMRRFWKNQAALNAGDPIALTHLPPEVAEAARDLWERALRLSQQTALVDDNTARQRLEELQRATDTRAHSLELREKEWDMAARVRDRALSDTRAQMNQLFTQLALVSADLRNRNARIKDLESQIEAYRRQWTTAIAGVGSRGRHKALRGSEPAGPARPKRRPSKKVAPATTRQKTRRQSRRNKRR